MAIRFTTLLTEDSMAKITEIAPDVYRLSIYAPWGNLQFNRLEERARADLDANAREV